MEGGRRDCIFVSAYLAFVWVFLSPRTVPLPCHRRWPWPSLFFVAGCRSTHWGQMTHICVGQMTRISSDNDLVPEQRQAIFWTNTGILLIGPLGTNFSEILIEIQTFFLNMIHLKMPSANIDHFSWPKCVKRACGGPMMPYSFARPGCGARKHGRSTPSWSGWWHSGGSQQHQHQGQSDQESICLGYDVIFELPSCVYWYFLVA